MDVPKQIIPRYGPCGVEELKPRMLRAVASMEPAEIREILDEQGGKYPTFVHFYIVLVTYVRCCSACSKEVMDMSS